MISHVLSGNLCRISLLTQVVSVTYILYVALFIRASWLPVQANKNKLKFVLNFSWLAFLWRSNIFWLLSSQSALTCLFPVALHVFDPMPFCEWLQLNTTIRVFPNMHQHIIEDMHMHLRAHTEFLMSWKVLKKWKPFSRPGKFWDLGRTFQWMKKKKKIYKPNVNVIYLSNNLNLYSRRK